MKKSFLIGLSLFILYSSNIAYGNQWLNPFWNYIYTHFEFMPEYHIETDLFTFFLHKSSFFKERYYLENNVNLDFVLVSYKKTLYSVWDFQFMNGMGQTPGNVVFDVMDINYGIIPTIELRLSRINIFAGINHHCFHEIDRAKLPIVYWNKGFIGIGSKNMRLFEYWSALTEKKIWTFTDRIQWNIRASYYAKEFFGLVSPNKINGHNPFDMEASFDVRYALACRRSWIFVCRSSLLFGTFKQPVHVLESEHGMYSRWDVSFESNFKRGKKGAMIFVAYTLDKLPLYDDIPRFSKDQLLQVGLRFFL